ncbi:MAG: PQQ-binding-like beta-propeller repeat protein [Planctomycetota bacterium]|nr:PQQ-binding-like beta-propeller repeat protein [Planctomycetota bacterium]
MARNVCLLLLVLSGGAAAFAAAAPTPASDWPQWRGPGRDGVWNESPVLEKFPWDRIPVKWRSPVGSGYSGPTVAGGRVYVADRRVQPSEGERILCFDAATGRPLWTYAYDAAYGRVGYPAGPRACVSIAGGRAFALGAVGHLTCLDAATGQLLWKKDPAADYRVRVPTWGIAAAPLVDGDQVIVQIGASEEGACLVALETATGKEKWRALGDRASYSAPILIQQAGRRVLVCWTGDSVAGLDPATGKTFWQHPTRPAKMVINVPTPIVDRDRLFLSAFYDGSYLFRLRQDQVGVELLWHRRGQSETKTDALHAMISTPYFQGDYLYGVDSYGELRCLDARTGDRVWEDLSAVPKARWSTIHITRNGDRLWMLNERGELLIATVSPQGFNEISRAKLIEPTTDQLSQRGGVCWSPPAYAQRHIFARNDRELLCASLAPEGR